MPPETYHAFKDHGTARLSLTENMAEARSQVDSLAGLGIDFTNVTDTLLEAGVNCFIKSFESLMGGIKAKREKLAAEMK